MKSLKMFSTAIAFVMLIVAVKSTIWKDYRLEVLKSVAPARSLFKSLATLNPYCYTNGLLCGGCKDVYFCDSNNNYRAKKVWTCNSTQTCNKGQCTNYPNFECSPPGLKEFPCQMEGIFPDPGNCFKYHICVAVNDDDRTLIKSHEERTCKGNFFSYNARTGYCDKRLDNNTCPGYAIPFCTAPGQTGALKENPSIYYTCREYEETTPVTDKDGKLVEQEGILYPFLQICDYGGVYNASTFRCYYNYY